MTLEQAFQNIVVMKQAFVGNEQAHTALNESMKMIYEALFPKVEEVKQELKAVDKDVV